MKSRPRTYKAVPEATETASGELSAAIGLPWRGPGMPRLIIGRREWIALPELGISPLKAKTDSGAWNSCLHAENVTLSEDETTVSFFSINYHGERIRCEAEVARIGRVKSSTGISKPRIFIHTPAVFSGGLKLILTVSLANRADMHCPMLLGRRALSGYFLIDPQSAHLLGPRSGLEKR